MKPAIHPKYEAVEIKCSCGAVIQTRSTRMQAMHLDVCSKCHPFYTGEQRIIDTAGRVERFNRRFQRPGN